MTEESIPPTPQATVQERRSTLEQLEAWLHVPMMVLSLVWLFLVLSELIWGDSRLLDIFGGAIWIVFLTKFGIRLAVSPCRVYDHPGCRTWR